MSWFFLLFASHVDMHASTYARMVWHYYPPVGQGMGPHVHFVLRKFAWALYLHLCDKIDYNPFSKGTLRCAGPKLLFACFLSPPACPPDILPRETSRRTSHFVKFSPRNEERGPNSKGKEECPSFSIGMHDIWPKVQIALPFLHICQPSILNKTYRFMN